jgi:hypothetical protein
MPSACAILSSMACCPTLHHFPTSHKWHDFWKVKEIEHKMCVSIFSTTFVWNLFHSKKGTEIWSKKYVVFHVKYLLFLYYFNKNLMFSKVIWKIIERKISWKSIKWEQNYSIPTECLMDSCNEANSCFHNFTNELKIRVFRKLLEYQIS